MKFTRMIGILSALALAASFSAQAQVKIGVITAATGPAAFVGIPQKNAVASCPGRSAIPPSNTSISMTPATRPKA